MAFDSLIFDLEDVRQVRKVSVNIDDFGMYAQEVQRNYLQKILGAKLYAAMLAGLAELSVPQKWTDLVDGVTYVNGSTIIYRGLKIYCSYLWLYLYNLDSEVSHTPIGARIFKDEFVDMAKNKQAIDHFIKSADGMEEGIIDFIRFKVADYPEFSESLQIEPAKNSNLTFKVIGKTYKSPDNYWSK